MEEQGFHRDSVLKHLTDLLLGEIEPTTEADKKFLDNIAGIAKEYSNEETKNAETKNA